MINKRANVQGLIGIKMEVLRFMFERIYLLFIHL